MSNTECVSCIASSFFSTFTIYKCGDKKEVTATTTSTNSSNYSLQETTIGIEFKLQYV